MNDSYPLILLSVLAVGAVYIQRQQSKNIIIQVYVSKYMRIFLYLFTITISIFIFMNIKSTIAIISFSILLIALNFFVENSGLSENGLYYNSRGLISKKIPFERTSDWILYEKKNKLKCRINTKWYKNSNDEAIYLSFNKDDKEKIIDHLLVNDLLVKVEKFK